MVTITKCNYKQYGQCISVSNGAIELIATTQIGPRIIFLGEKGGENIMYEDAKDLINKGGEFFDENLPNKGIWHIYGGHRLWKSPEYMDTYYPDNSPVQVEIDGASVSLTSDIELTTHIEKCITISMTNDGAMTIRHSFTNKGDETTPPISLWGLSVLDKGAKAIIPLSTENTGFLANRNLVLWSYTDIKDPRLTIEQDKVILAQANIAQAIKIGTRINQPVKVLTKGLQFDIAFDDIEDGNYPDFSCNVETYTNDIMLEIETLSPLFAIKAGETKTHSERWTLNRIK
ncbi:MAG: hypothetical protein RSD04_03355 [Clostridia bacterium]